MRRDEDNLIEYIYDVPQSDQSSSIVITSFTLPLKYLFYFKNHNCLT